MHIPAASNSNEDLLGYHTECKLSPKMYERVLIIDDSTEIRDFLAEYILEPRGYRVLAAANGLMGLEMAIAERPDLMITDQQMPQMTGLQVLQKLRERKIDIPAILMTGQGSEETAVAAFRLGIRDYIIKPIDAEELTNSIENALRENRLQKERDQLVDQLMGSNSQLQRRAQELNVLYSVGKSVSSSLDLEEVLHRVVEAAVYVVGAEEGSLMLLDEERGELYIRASKNLDSKAQTLRKRVTDSLAGTVLQTQQAVAIGNDSPTERTHTALLVKSLIYVPLILQDKAIGVLGVMNYLHDSSFDSNDTRALSALGGYATIAINNANIYKEIERERNTLSAVVKQTYDPVIVVDSENRLLLLNNAAQNAFAISPETAIGHPITSMIENENLLYLIRGNQDDDREHNTKVINHNGHAFQARLTRIEGGSCFILLRRVEK
ncbi:MAG: response regulator [Anaerolineaceae bacterium]|nr:MAG: response regulator [Anaerolineaceae bacterium]